MRRLQDIAAHEYTHAIMNAHLEPYGAAFTQKMQMIGAAVGQDFNLPLQEVFAQSVGYLELAKNYPSYVNGLIFYQKNLLFPHVVAHMLKRLPNRR